MAERVTDEDLELLGELGVDAEPATTGGRSAREQRVIAGFEEIVRFVDEHGRPPRHGERLDIFERLYAVRLDRLRGLAEHHEILRPLDKHGLLSDFGAGAVIDEVSSDEDLLASLGVENASGSDVSELKHVRPHVERKAAEEVAHRAPCADFEKFRPVFDQVQRELDSGVRQTARFQHNGKLDPGDLFILDGQKVLVAGAGEVMMKDFGREDRRLRVVFDNGTESNMLLRSLQRALYKDAANRRILPARTDAAPLFSDELSEGDTHTGSVYVLRSLSDHSFIAKHRDVIHKIGVTGGEVKSRIGNAKKDPTYLLADVEIVAEFPLANVDRRAVEALLHKLFAPARLDLELKDRFGLQVEPREWFLVPVTAISEALARVIDGTIEGYRYDRMSARLTKT
jgi:hypothetical protein